MYSGDFFGGTATRRVTDKRESRAERPQGAEVFASLPCPRESGVRKGEWDNCAGTGNSPWQIIVCQKQSSEETSMETLRLFGQRTFCV